MLDIKWLRENKEIVKKNIEKKFQHHKLALVDEVIELDKKMRDMMQEEQSLRSDKNKKAKEIGLLMGKGLKEEAEKLKKEVNKNADRLEELTSKIKEITGDFLSKLGRIPNIIDNSVPNWKR